MERDVEITLIKLNNSLLLCDNGACTHKADYKISRADTAKGHELVLCKECLKKIKGARYPKNNGGEK